MDALEEVLLALRRDDEKKFDPNQPRDPHTGEWINAAGEHIASNADVLARARADNPNYDDMDQNSQTAARAQARSELQHPEFDNLENLSEKDQRKVLYAGHKGTPEDPVPCGDNLDRAVRIIADGGNVKLNQPDQVATLLDKLRDIVKEAEAKGEKAPNYDLCNVTVPGTNLFCQDEVKRSDGTTIDRVQMPQLSTKDPVPGSYADSKPRNKKGEVDLSEDFAKFLASQGRAPTLTTIDASHLRASQSELNGAKVAGIAGAVADGKIDVNDPKGAIYVTEDNYVIDGHHRWAAYVAESYRTGKPIQMPVRVVHTDIGSALTTANFWTEQQGIPPADVTKKSSAWLYDMAITSPELLDIVQKLDTHPGDRGNAGNISSIIKWFLAGADGQIAWGSPGDFYQCVAVASRHLGVHDAHGFCQNRHQEATGMSTAEHAHLEGKGFDPNQPRDPLTGEWVDVPGSGGNPLVR